MNGVSEFCRYLVHEYLENCNYDIFEKHMAPTASVIGTGGTEFFPSLKEFSQAIKNEEKVRAGLSDLPYRKKKSGRRK